jgi:threonine dehydratase
MRDAILAAHERIRALVRETPVEYAPELGAWLKLEHLQKTGSFKFRGACHKVALLTADQSAAGVVTASNGNHGLGVAAAAEARGIAAEVFVSAHVSVGKARRIEAHGARLHRAGEDPLTAELAARRAAEETGRVFISPYNDVDVMAGQGTIGVELLRQLPEVGSVFVAVGGGGLIGGIGAYVKEARPEVEVVGCWPENSPVLYECMRAGRVIDVAERPTLSESTSGGLEPGTVTLDVCRRVIDRAVFVTEDEIRDAMRLVLRTEHWLVEGAAAVAVAAFRKAGGRNAAIVLCGRNLSAEAFNLVF